MLNLSMPLIANVSTEYPHEGTAWERFTDRGPMALLPQVGGPQPGHRSALVWTLSRAELDELLALSDDAPLLENDADAVAAFAAHVDDCPEVVACHALTGEMDYLLHIVVADLEHFSRFLLDRLLAQAGVADVNSSFVLRTVKAYRGLPLPVR